MARPNGGLEDRGMPGASHRPPTSSSTSTRRPCRHPRRSFPSCPVAVPAPPRDRGKVAPSRSEAAGPTLGRGARRVGRRVAPPMVGGGAEAEARVPLAGSSREPRLQAAGRGRGMGGERARWKREETGGGSRRRGGRRGGRVGPRRVEGAPGGRTLRPQPPRATGLRPGSPTRFLLGLRATGGPRDRHLGSSGLREGSLQKWKGWFSRRGAGTEAGLLACRPGRSTGIEDRGLRLIAPPAAQEPQGEARWVCWGTAAH